MKFEELDLYALKYFFDTVETGSFTDAAEINFVTRSAISQSIRRVENWVGKNLVTHERKIFNLTGEGEIFYRRMKASYQAFQISIASPLESAWSLKVGCSSSLVESLLFPAIKKLSLMSSLQLSTGTTSQLRDRLTEDKINIALFVGDKSPAEKNELIIKSGNFVLASGRGKNNLPNHHFRGKTRSPRSTENIS